MDNSEAMINLAKEKFPHSKYPNLSFKVLDAKELNFNEEFDVILSNAALHWVDDHLKVLKGMYNQFEKMLDEFFYKWVQKEMFLKLFFL